MFVAWSLLRLWDILPKKGGSGQVLMGAVAGYLPAGATAGHVVDACSKRCTRQLSSSQQALGLELPNPAGQPENPLQRIWEPGFWCVSPTSPSPNPTVGYGRCGCPQADARSPAIASG